MDEPEKDGCLSDSLVPVICRDDLERVADDFFKKYYPEARLKPMRVDPSKLAKRMGLAVISHTISENGTVFGQICFWETDATLCDEKQERTVTEHVMPGTIVVDPDVVFQGNLGACNKTNLDFL